MDCDGIETRPLRLMTGGPSATVFFTDVRIPAGGLLGPENGGLVMIILTPRWGSIGAVAIGAQRLTRHGRPVYLSS
jgi:alkylation response protein AidB-like acyl-CoA dehydrogenase